MNKRLDKNESIYTQCIHGYDMEQFPYRAMSMPIVQSSNFTFQTIDQVTEAMGSDEDDYVYTRGGNPTIKVFEQLMATLEKGKYAVGFSSGMGAISSVIMSLLEAGDEIIINHTLYGNTFNFVTKTLKQFGIRHQIADLQNLHDLEDRITPDTKVIYFESPDNPLLGVIDIGKVCEIAKKHDIKVVIDNTFATPYHQNPLELGVDVVVHSASKYICGHGDVVGGVAISNDKDYADRLRFQYMCLFGSVISPFDAWLLIRGLKTFSARMERHNKNTQKVVEFLLNHPLIEKVHYPGIKSDPSYAVANRQMKNGFGGILSFEIKGKYEDAVRFVEHVNLSKLAVSLGDCDTLVEIPIVMTHKGYSQSILESMGIKENLIRMSIGLEDPDDIIADISKGLAAIQ
ncbi:O-acetylhomoserine aminocarboxypropyltransferase [Aedoeadaptatus coxii]|uniref:trans-sulfuration enzyme family protein n=1 Tax=Aedoeadaptatus coxii TaxID=755172 RepID=UPI00175326EF|nr:PLP-dependent aspartate aminotransferase family protein [Peptoniphilus coxii]CAC9933552.1 O-acetylhomoserine aminocarboxypropyltransferase [Peptoniphilus coxii]